MQFLFMCLFALGIVGLDQLSKYLVLANIPLFSHVPFIPGFLGLTYVQNTGAAWSILEGQIWFFTLIFAVLTVAIVWAYWKNAVPFSKFEWFCVAAIYGGGLGNMIDRLRLGFVVDMIRTEFITFPIFNIADCFITCGCILLIAHILFFNKGFWKEEKK